MHDERRECTSGWSDCIERIDWKGSQKLQSKRWFSPPPTCRDLAPSASNEAENAMHMTHYHSPIPKSPTCKRHRGQNTTKTDNVVGFGHAVPAHGFLFRPLGHGSARGHHMHRSMSNGWLPQASIGPGKPKPSARMCIVSLFFKKNMTDKWFELTVLHFLKVHANSYLSIQKSSLNSSWLLRMTLIKYDPNHTVSCNVCMK